MNYVKTTLLLIIILSQWSAKANFYTYYALTSKDATNETEILQFADSLKKTKKGGTWDFNSMKNRFGNQLTKITVENNNQTTPYTLNDSNYTKYTYINKGQAPLHCSYEELFDTICFGKVNLPDQNLIANTVRFSRKKKDLWLDCGDIPYPTYYYDYDWYADGIAAPIAQVKFKIDTNSTGHINNSVTLFFIDSISIINSTDYCHSYTYHNNQYTTDSTFKTLSNSLHQINSLTVDSFLKTSTLTNTIILEDLCNSYTIKGKTYHQNTQVKDTLTTSSGCDSIVTYVLVFKTYSTYIAIDTCTSYIYNGTKYTSNIRIIDTLVSALGCDSIVTIDLLFQNYGNTIDITSCGEYNLLGKNYSSSTTVFDTLKTIGNCDSIITYNLTIEPIKNESYIQTCDNSYLFKNVNYHSDTTVIDTIKTISNCDSIHSTTIIFNQNNNFDSIEIEDFETETLCKGKCSQEQCALQGNWKNISVTDEQDWFVHKGYSTSGQNSTGPKYDHTTSSGQYIYMESDFCTNNKAILYYSCGLDLTNYSSANISFWYYMWGWQMEGSLKLVVEKMNGNKTEVFVKEGVQSKAWVNAIIDLTPFSGEKIQMWFEGTPKTQDKSDIALDDIKISGTKLITSSNAISENNINIFPNPASGILIIDGLPTGQSNVIIFNINQQIVYKSTLNKESNKINISNLPSGSYTIMIQTANGVSNKILIKQ